MVFLFPTSILLFCHKRKYDLLPKNTLKNYISGIIEKDDIHPRKYGIYSHRKIKDNKTVYSVK